MVPRLAETAGDDPYPALHALRARSPVTVEDDGSVWVSSYREAVAVLRRGEYVRLDARPETPIEALRPVLRPASVERLRETIAARVEGLAAYCAARRRVDIVADVAFPLSVDVVGDLMDIPESGRDELRDVARTLAPLFDTSGPEVVAATAAARDRFDDLVGELTRRRMRSPGRDALSELADPVVAGRGLAVAEVVENALFLLLAGQQTTMNLIANAVHAFALHPHEWARLSADPLWPRFAVEETLRWNSPLQRNVRLCGRDTTLGDQRVPAGAVVSVLIGAANRDPARFAEPDRFDVGRPRNTHLSFGMGEHHCFGAGLARAEATAVLAAFRRRFAGLELGEPVRWRRLMNFRGPETLVVEVRSG